MQTADFYSSATGTLRVNGGRDENAPQGVSLSIDDLSYIKQGSRTNENSDSFTPTQAQLDAMNSGITSEDVEQISTNKNNISSINQHYICDNDRNLYISATEPTGTIPTGSTWIDGKTIKTYGRTSQLFDYTTMSDGVDDAYLAADGSEVSASVWAISDYIPCDGTSFTINPIGGNESSICLYDENKTYITGKAYMTGGASTKRSISITATSSAKYIRFTYRKSTASNPDDLSEIMLNEGTTALPFQNYLEWK